MDIKTITGVVGIDSGRKTHVATVKVITIQEWFDSFYRDLENGHKCYKGFRDKVICIDNPYTTEDVEDQMMKLKESLITSGNKYYLISYEGYLCGTFDKYVTYDNHWIKDLPKPTELNVTCKKCLSKLGVK